MPNYFDFEVFILETEPRIWRRFLVPEKATFAKLHEAIQHAFGWEDCHLWQFSALAGKSGPSHEEPIAGVPEISGSGDPVPDAKKVKLVSYFKDSRAGQQLLYRYDFGDCWDHEVKLHGIVSDKLTFHRRLLDGDRACPPEDCGGIDGYQRMVHFVQTGKDLWDDDPEGLKEWIGNWKPDNFSLKTAKSRFRR